MTLCILNCVTDRNVDQHEHSGPCEIKSVMNSQIFTVKTGSKKKKKLKGVL